MQIIVTLPGKRTGVNLTFVVAVNHKENHGSEEHLKEFQKAAEACANVNTISGLLDLQKKEVINILSH